MKALFKKLQIYGLKNCFFYAGSELYNKIMLQLLKRSYSQKGEDLIIDRLLRYKQKGFYVDIGAYDPHRFSNTKRFYRRGWNGINIEPNPLKYKKFLICRRADINLNIGIGNTDRKKLKFYRFIPDALSTFSEKEAERYIKQGYILEDSIDVPVKKLIDILDKYCRNRSIDFMSIDTEGFDLDVLKSNDWSRFRPKLICIESVVHSIERKKISNKKNYEFFLKKVNYKKVYDNNLNSFYVEADNI